MHLAKLYEDAHFTSDPESGQTACGVDITEDFLITHLSDRNAVYYIAKFDDARDLDICTECREYVDSEHELQDDEYNQLVEKANST